MASVLNGITTKYGAAHNNRNNVGTRMNSPLLAYAMLISPSQQRGKWRSAISKRRSVWYGDGEN